MKDKLTIIISNRNTLSYLQLCVKSLRENNNDIKYELLIVDDNSTDGSKDWLNKNKTKYGFKYTTHNEPIRKGVVGTNTEGIKKAKGNIIMLAHSDMYFAKEAISRLYKRINKGKIMCSTRIEPPIYPHEDCRIQKPFGVMADEFKEKEFNEYVDTLLQANEGITTDGMFAPTMFYKDDWIGYDTNFAPQSREDSDMFYTWKRNSMEFVQCWDSLVYHFSGKGSRRKDDSASDTKEWKRTETRNIREFIRKWGATPLNTKYLHPIIPPDIKLSCIIIMSNEEDLIYNQLYTTEPYFDEIIIVNDKSIDNSINEIKRYIKDTKEDSKLFNESKIKIIDYKDKNTNFSDLRNLGNKHVSHDWVMEIDCDEQYTIQFLNNLRFIANKGDENNIEVFGFPRKNTIDGKDTGVYPDYQFRFHKKGIGWIGNVHEVLKPVFESIKQPTQSVQVVSDMVISHPKTTERQSTQNKFYRKIMGQEIKNIFIDSVMYTNEGITHHAREEAKEFYKRGWTISLFDLYKENKFGDIFKKMYNPIDVTKKTYVTYVNQPPIRWTRSFGLDNFIGYFAFEGKPPTQYIKIMNDNNVKEIWTPSTYCKQIFKDGGVTKPIKVIPHGINPELWAFKEKKLTKEPFVFLGAGTMHNCLSENTLLTLSNGDIKQFKDVNLSDVLIGQTGKCNIVNKSKVKKEECILKVQGLENISGSMEHKLLVMPREKMFIKQKKSGKNIYNKTFKESDFIFKEIKDIIPGDYLISKNKVINKKIEYNYDFKFGYVLGFLLGDGNIIEEPKRWRYGIRFYQKKNTGTEKRIIQTLKDVFCEEPKIYYNKISNKFGKCIMSDINLFGKNYVDIIKKYLDGNKFDNKKLKNIDKMSFDMINGILSGFFDADGCYTDNFTRMRFSGKNRTLLNQIFSLARFITNDCSINEQNNVFNVEISCNKNKKRQIKYNNKYVLHRILSKEITSNKIDMYDIEVDGNNTFIANNIISHNSRKGLDILIKAFSEEFKQDENVELLLKISNIYNPNDDIDFMISEHINESGNKNINLITDVVSDEEIVDLFHNVNCYVSPHRCEGFGIFILQAMASGTPVIATDFSGNVDFTKGRILELNTTGDYVPVGDPTYENATWKEPDKEQLKKYMRQVYEGKYPHNLKEISDYIRENYTWKKIVDKMELEIGKF